MSFSPSGTMGPFVSTTREFPREQDEFFPTLEHTYTELAQAINARVIGLYSTEEMVTGKLYIDVSNNATMSFRKHFTFSAIVPGATLNIAHGISGSFMLTCVDGGIVTASDTRPLPYVDAATVTNQVSVSVDSTNIIIINGATAPAITSGNITIEYLYT